MQLTLANPRGFCAGVDRAIEIVNRALELFGAPIYVRHEVVHNKAVVSDLRERGAIFVNEVHEVPDDNILIFSAHGVSQQVRQEAEQRQLKIFDATCPLVTKVHLEVSRYCRNGTEVILIGHKGHPEVEGTLGQYDTGYGGQIYLVESAQDVMALQVNNPQQLAYVSQTTLSMDDTQGIIEALQKQFPQIQGPRKNDICYATQNRQDAVKSLARKSHLVLVVGSQNSSNSNRLKEVALRQDSQAYLIDNADEIQAQWLENIETIGLTAGASAPEHLVEQVKQRLSQLGVKHISEDTGKKEDIVFSLPKELQSKSNPA